MSGSTNAYEYSSEARNQPTLEAFMHVGSEARDTFLARQFYALDDKIQRLTDIRALEVHLKELTTQQARIEQNINDIKVICSRREPGWLLYGMTGLSLVLSAWTVWQQLKIK